MSSELGCAQDFEPQTGPVYRGAGDCAFAAVIRGEGAVVYADAAPQQALVHLKAAAVRALPVQSVRSFLGFGHFGRRVWFYHEVRGGLPDAVRAWWDAREPLIRAGLCQAGLAEQRSARFRTRVLPLAHRAAEVEALFARGSLDEQRAWLEARWFTRRWSLVAAHPVGRAIDAALRTRLAQQDPGLQWWLLGRYPDLERGPAYLSTAGHAALRAGLDRLRIGGSAQ